MLFGAVPTRRLGWGWGGLLGALALAGSARASVEEAAGRVYTLAAERSVHEGYSVALAGDGGVYVIASPGEGVYRLAPSESRLRRVARGASYSDVAAGAAGDVLLSDGTSRVWRLWPDGALAVAAGAGNEEASGFAGDGGPATAAQLCAPSAIAGQPDGGFVFSDGSYVVRRVSADGTISTAAATLSPPVCGWVSGAEEIVDLAAMLDGGFAMLLRSIPEGPSSQAPGPAPVPRPGAVVAVATSTATPMPTPTPTPTPTPPDVDAPRTSTRVVRVAPSGEWSTLVKPEARYILSIAVTADGSLLTTTEGRLLRWPVGGGRPTVVLKDRSSRLFDGDGDRVASYSTGTVSGVAAAPDGGIVVVGTSEGGSQATRLLYVSPRQPGRMAVALRPRDSRARAGGYVARYLATRPGAASLSVRNERGRTVATAGDSAAAGRNTITVRRRLPAGIYTVRLVVSGIDGQRAADSLKLVLGGRLPLRLARDTLRPSGDCGSTCQADVADGPCRRFGPRRVDCRFSLTGDPYQKCSTGSALLRRYGIVRVRAYTCPPRNRPPFPRHPRYHGHGHDAAPIQAR